MDGHKVEEGGEGAPLTDTVFSTGEGAEVAIEVKTNAVVVIKHGDDVSKRTVETEGEEDFTEETPIDSVIRLRLVHGDKDPIQLLLITVEAKLLDEQRDVTRELTRAETMLVRIDHLMDVACQAGSNGAGEDTVEGAEDSNGTEVVQAVQGA